MLSLEREAAYRVLNNMHLYGLGEEILKLIAGSDLVKLELYPPEGNWEVGDLVQYRRVQDWGPSQGDYGYITELREDNNASYYADYQVFWVRPYDPETDLLGSGTCWTTPDDVVLVKKAKNIT